MDLTKKISATGTVQPRDSVEVSSKITARVKEIPVKENDTVVAGQVVAILDGKDFEAKRD
ncbi:MAG: biotin/lipoyl-binding protein, partial [Selenomonadaceae bacterium]|nr:biotin/lipoyl-binding protein [Selenomonadaceae bacterium]